MSALATLKRNDLLARLRALPGRPKLGWSPASHGACWSPVPAKLAESTDGELHD